MSVRKDFILLNQVQLNVSSDHQADMEITLLRIYCQIAKNVELDDIVERLAFSKGTKRTKNGASLA